MVKENTRSSANPSHRSAYVLQIQGELNGRWMEWFSAVRITVERSDDRPPLTTLHCPTMDQAMLRGVINKIWDMNLILVSVRQIPTPVAVVESMDVSPMPDEAKGSRLGE